MGRSTLFCKNLVSNLDQMLSISTKIIIILYSMDNIISNNTRKELEFSISKILEEIKNESNVRIKDIKEKRLNLIKKRLKRYDELIESKKMMNERFYTIKETVKYLYEQLLLSLSTDEIDIVMNTIIKETEVLESTIKDMENFLEIYKDIKV